MKLTLIIIFLSVIQVSANVYSQATVNLNVQNKPVREVLKTIEQQCQVRFFYSDDLLAMNEMISLKADNENIKGVLDEIFSESPLTFKTYENNLFVIIPRELTQEKQISGTVIDAKGMPMPGVNVIISGTAQGVTTDSNGRYTIEVPEGSKSLTFSFIGMQQQEVSIGSLTRIDVTLAELVTGLNEVVVVGYGSQKRSDITGTVASLPKERLEKAPNLNIAQAIQGSIPGVMIQTTSAGADPNQSIMIRGRNSIKASNEPLVVVDGIPYGGNIADISPTDVLSIEILKDASSAAIYGSRGANGVILITTKAGSEGKSTISYDGFYSIQKFSDLPDIMNGAEFYDFKMTRGASWMTLEEKAIYDAGTWENWYDLLLRNGASQQHNLSVSGGTKNSKYYISGGLFNVKGLTVNDKYTRLTNRVNVETSVKPWLTIGTRTQFSYDNRDGAGPSWDDAYSMNPLTKAYDANGNLNIYPWEGNPYFANPLQAILYKDMNQAFQIITNNFVVVDFPFVKGLSYRLNTGFRFGFSDRGQYRGRNTKSGLDALGRSSTDRTRTNNSVIENILSFTRDFGKHSVFATAVYSYEGNKDTNNSLDASGFPHDFLSWYSAAQATLISPGYTYDETNLISQMLRVNYTFDKRYLITLTGRRDGFSGFGAQTKWGIFPSLALGWNVANETFFPLKNIFDEFKLRASYGLNGNQAVGAYQTISRLEQYDIVSSKITVPGYRPSVLGQDNLGWETSKTVNAGLDFGIFKGRITGDINLYRTNTTDLLLDRTISSVHGITSITQNIGETQNSGLEISIFSRNIVKSDFQWSTTANISFNKNKIISLYGTLDENGNETNDVANKWFIGQPIRVNYDFKWLGTWQIDEAEEAAKWNSQPGFVKLQDVNRDYKLDANDMQILGQQDPQLIWGLTNSLSYRNFKLDIFVHGVHGITAVNEIMTDNVTAEIRENTMKKNWWTPENPTNEWVVNNINAEIMGGINANDRYYQDASFIRVKDISLSYDLPSRLLERAGFSKARFYLTGRNMLTFTKWTGLDPELSDQKSTPLQKEYVLGLNFSF